MNLDIIAQRLQTMGLGVSGTSLFVQFMPENKTGIVLIADPMGALIDAELPQFREVVFQAVTRGKDYDTGKALAVRLVEELFIEQEERLGDYEVKSLRARHRPIPFQRSPGGNFEFLVSFDVVCLDNAARR